MKAWYFASPDKKLGYGDNRKITIGRTHKVKGTPECCEHGLHGSIKILDALVYAKGPIIYRVDISGNVDTQSNKICGNERTYLYGGIDISDTLREFARWCALQVVHLWDASEVVVKYLKTGDDSLRDAARAAARAAAWDATWDATWDARAAARDAAWAATWDATWDARDAARDAAWDAGGAATWDAARDAAWDAAWDAVREKQNRKLTSMVNKLLRNTK